MESQTVEIPQSESDESPQTVETPISNQSEQSPQSDWRAKLGGSPTVEEERPDPGPVQIVAKQSIAKNPFVLLALTGGGLTIIVIVGALLFMGLNFTIGGTSSEPTQADLKEFKEDERVFTPQEEQIATLQDKLGDKTANTEIAMFNKAAVKEEAQPTAKAVPPSPRPARSSSGRTVPVPKIIARDPSPAPRRQPQRRPLAPPPRPQVRPKLVAAVPPPPPVQTQSEPQSQDPYQQWEQLAKLGYFGSGETVRSRPRINPIAQPSFQNAVLSSGDNNPVASPVFNPNAQAPSQRSQSRRSGSQTQMKLGTTGQGRVLEDVIWDVGGNAPSSVLIQMSEDFGDIPKDAIIQASVDSISNAGRLSLSMENMEVDGRLKSVNLRGVSIEAKAKVKGTGGNKTFGRIASSLLNIGADALLDSSGQSVNFDSRGRISNIATDSGNEFLDRIVDTGSNELSRELRGGDRSRSRQRTPEFLLKKGAKVEFLVASR